MRRLAVWFVMFAVVSLTGCTQPKATSTAPKGSTPVVTVTTPIVEATKPAATKPAESKPGDKTTSPASPK